MKQGATGPSPHPIQEDRAFQNVSTQLKHLPIEDRQAIFIGVTNLYIQAMTANIKPFPHHWRLHLFAPDQLALSYTTAEAHCALGALADAWGLKAYTSLAKRQCELAVQYRDETIQPEAFIAGVKQNDRAHLAQRVSDNPGDLRKVGQRHADEILLLSSTFMHYALSRMGHEFFAKPQRQKRE